MTATETRITFTLNKVINTKRRLNRDKLKIYVEFLIICIDCVSKLENYSIVFYVWNLAIHISIIKSFIQIKIDFLENKERLVWKFFYWIFLFRA